MIIPKVLTGQVRFSGMVHFALHQRKKLVDKSDGAFG
jgi:hypothetical protein